LLEGVIFVKNQERILIISYMKNMPPVVIVAIIIAIAVLLIQFFFEL